MLHRIRRVGVYQTSIVVAALYGLVGLLFAPFIWLMGRLPATEGAATLEPMGSMGAMSIVFAIGAPILYAVIGFITTAIACVIYNLLAKLTGGIEIELVVAEPS